MLFQIYLGFYSFHYKLIRQDQWYISNPNDLQHFWKRVWIPNKYWSRTIFKTTSKYYVYIFFLWDYSWICMRCHHDNICPYSHLFQVFRSAHYFRGYPVSTVIPSVDKGSPGGRWVVESEVWAWLFLCYVPPASLMASE